MNCACCVFIRNFWLARTCSRNPLQVQMPATGSVFVGPLDDLRDVLAPHVKEPDFLPKDRFCKDPCTMVRFRGLWQNLRKLPHGLSLGKKVTEETFAAIASDHPTWNFGVLEDGTPVTAKDWATAQAARLRIAAQHLRKCLAYQRPAQWVHKIFGADIAVAERPSARSDGCQESAGESPEPESDLEEPTAKRSCHRHAAPDSDETQVNKWGNVMRFPLLYLNLCCALNVSSACFPRPHTYPPTPPQSLQRGLRPNQFELEV